VTRHMTNRADTMAVLEVLLQEGPCTIEQLKVLTGIGHGSVYWILNNTPGFKHFGEGTWGVDTGETISVKEIAALQDTLSGFSDGSSELIPLARHKQHPVFAENAVPEVFSPRMLISRLSSYAEIDYFIQLLNKHMIMALEYPSNNEAEPPNLNEIITELPKVIPVLQTLEHLIRYILTDSRRGTPEEWAILLTRLAKVESNGADQAV
jgi:hypothetical protein